MVFFITLLLFHTVFGYFYMRTHTWQPAPNANTPKNWSTACNKSTSFTTIKSVSRWDHIEKCGSFDWALSSFVFFLFPFFIKQINNFSIEMNLPECVCLSGNTRMQQKSAVSIYLIKHTHSSAFSVHLLILFRSISFRFVLFDFCMTFWFVVYKRERIALPNS